MLIAVLRWRPLLGLCLLLLCVAPRVDAGPILYTITFNPTAGFPTPDGGWFDFDASAPAGTQFSDFIVLWDPDVFDLTSSANNPDFSAMADACIPLLDCPVGEWVTTNYTHADGAGLAWVLHDKRERRGAGSGRKLQPNPLREHAEQRIESGKPGQIYPILPHRTGRVAELSAG